MIKKRIIFHTPVMFNVKLHSGSEISAQKMLKAFRTIGYDVDLVMGYVNDRKEQIVKIKQNIENGVKYDFLYSESSTVPTALTQKHHFPIAPFLDFDFFQFCKNHNIKIGLFYKDIHWKFDQYINSVPYLKRKLAEIFYKYDLTQYEKYVDILYLPSLLMFKHIPTSFDKQVIALPPGFEHNNKCDENSSGKSLNFIYVGGLGELYDLQLFTKVINGIKNIKFNLCTRENEWNKNKIKYQSSSIDVFHLSGSQLAEVYSKSSIGVLFVKPTKYWKFVMAVKLFEYISYKKPIVAVKNTAVGDFVEENNIGWTLDYDENELRNLIMSLQNNSSLVDAKIKNIEKIMSKHTWEARAFQVEKELTL